MGNYLFNTVLLLEWLERDAACASSQHDFGRDIIPLLIQEQPVYAYNLRQNRFPGEIVSGGQVPGSVLGRNVFVHSYSHVEESVIMDDCHIHHHARVRRAIIDKNVHVPAWEEIGWDQERDHKRFQVTESGIVVLPKGYPFAR